MSLIDHSGHLPHAASATSQAGSEHTTWAPSIGTYLTDGATLYRVEQTISDNTRGELFFELEDCASLEMVLCPARSLTVLGMRAVTPALGA